MKKKKLVIFFLALIPIYLIYKTTYNESITYISIGDDLAKGHTPFDTYSYSYTDYLYNYLKENNKEVILNKEYTLEDIRIKDLIDILLNPSLNERETLPQLIKDANIITISIGSEELFSKLRSTDLKENSNKLYEFIDSMINDYETLIKEIKRLNKNKIFIIGYYNPLTLNEDNKGELTRLFNYIDIKFKKLSSTYKIDYISIQNEFKNKPYYLPNKSSSFPSLEGYNYIANEIIKKLES